MAAIVERKGSITPETASSHSAEKAGAVLVEEVSDEENDSTPRFNEKETSRLVRKLDYRLIPFLSLLYLLSYLDRTNIGNARLGGLEKSLHMEKLDYNIALAVFYPTYILAEIPSNMMMKKWRPSMWLPTIMVAWAVCTTLMGIVKSYHGLLACRIMLGVAEGGLFPGVTYYITMWYKRHECGFRIAIFYSAATAAGAFGGLLARGIMEMNHIGGLAGWQWLFIIEGLVTLIVAITAYKVLVDYPATAKFLNPAEKKEVVLRLKEDHSDLANEFDLKYFWDALKDWKIYVHMLITLAIYTSNYSVGLFLPTIVKTLGYTNQTAQLMTVPPYIFACITCISGGWLGDKTRQRGLWMIACCAFSMIGLFMLLLSSNLHIRYAGVFFMAGGFFPNVPQGAAWQGNNVGGSLKRGVALAMHVGFGNLGGIVASFVYLPKDAPKYHKGLSILIGLNAMAIILAGIMTTYYRRENARRDREFKAPELYTAEEKAAERTKGDYASYFRYSV